MRSHRAAVTQAERLAAGWNRACSAPDVRSADRWTHEWRLRRCGRDEDPDGVVGVPAGGGRRARTARLPVGDGAGRRRTRRRGAQPPAHRTPTRARIRRPTRSSKVCGSVAAAHDPHEFDFGSDMMAWTLAMGHSMTRAGLALRTPGRRTKPWRPDVVHAHDWLVAHPAIALAEFFDVPLVSTIHATEAGRHSGWVSGRISRQVHAVESWLVRESDSLITCSRSMSDEITELFGPGLAEIRVIRNGIDARAVAVREAAAAQGSRPAALSRQAGVREGHPRRDRGAAAHPAYPSRHDADDRGRRHPV